MSKHQAYYLARRSAAIDLNQWIKRLNMMAQESPNSSSQIQARAACDFRDKFQPVLFYLLRRVEEEEERGDGKNLLNARDQYSTSPQPNTSVITGRSQLPNELYHHIVSFVDTFEEHGRRKTLLGICHSSHLLRQIAEPLYYRHPHKLNSIKHQWQFLFLLHIRPDPLQYIRSLHCCWLGGNENGPLLKRILLPIPSLEELAIVHGAQGSWFHARWVPFDQLDRLTEMLALCPQLLEFMYKTNERPPKVFSGALGRSESMYDDTQLDESQFRRGYQSLRLAEIAQRLTCLELRGNTEMLEDAFISHLSSQLRSLLVHRPYRSRSRRNAYRDLFKRCPNTSTDLRVGCESSVPFGDRS